MRDGRGRVPVRLAGGQGSHVLSALAAADALAIVPETDESLPAGADGGTLVARRRLRSAKAAGSRPRPPVDLGRREDRWIASRRPVRNAGD